MPVLVSTLLIYGYRSKEVLTNEYHQMNKCLWTFGDSESLNKIFIAVSDPGFRFMCYKLQVLSLFKHFDQALKCNWKKILYLSCCARDIQNASISLVKTLKKIMQHNIDYLQLNLLMLSGLGIFTDSHCTSYLYK